MPKIACTAAGFKRRWIQVDYGEEVSNQYLRMYVDYILRVFPINEGTWHVPNLSHGLVNVTDTRSIPSIQPFNISQLRTPTWRNRSIVTVPPGPQSLSVSSGF